MDIRINPEYEKLLPKLPPMEYEALKESIRNEGQHYPIMVNKEGIILDGHHRYRICNELRIPVKYEVVDFGNPLIEKKFVIEANLRRRHLNDFQKAELSYPLLEIERELAKQRQLSKLKQFQDNPPLASNEANGKSAEVVARKIGLSRGTFERAVKIIEEAPEELKENVRRGRVSIAYAYEMLVRKTEKHPQLPEGVFDVIYADPPWEYYLPLRGSPDMHYPVMSTEDICKLKVPAAEDAILFLWATNPKLEDALKVMRAWGFAYKTNMVWVKDRFGTGYYFRGQHELLLVGIKGNIGVPSEESRYPSVLIAPANEHSRKPDTVYEIIEQMYPNRRYLELFASRKRAGWVSWGTEVAQTSVNLSSYSFPLDAQQSDKGMSATSVTRLVPDPLGLRAKELCPPWLTTERWDKLSPEEKKVAWSNVPRREP